MNPHNPNHIHEIRFPRGKSKHSRNGDAAGEHPGRPTKKLAGGCSGAMGIVYQCRVASGQAYKEAGLLTQQNSSSTCLPASLQRPLLSEPNLEWLAKEKWSLQRPALVSQSRAKKGECGTWRPNLITDTSPKDIRHKNISGVYGFWPWTLFTLIRL